MIRRGTRDDYQLIADVMYEAVRYGRSAYNEAQRAAWLPEPPNGEAWGSRLDAQTVFVAEQGDTIVGFMTLAEGGYIDLAFVRPAAQGTGVFRRLLKKVENLALDHGERRLWVHASVTAKPAFEAVGFGVIREETVTVRGQSLDRYEMEFVLPSIR
jgi:putative acetyltransferase